MPSARTNLGPLTTRWKYPDQCTVVVTECITCDGGWQGQTCGDNDSNTQGVLDDPDCWPPRSGSFSTGNALNGWGFYSPAFECPQGYTAACHATGPETSEFEFQFSINDRETVKGCCPSGYTCAGAGGPQTCASIASRRSLQVGSCSDHKTVLNWLTLPATVTATSSVEIMDRITFYAPMFQLNHRERDISLSTTSSMQTKTTATSTSTAESSTDGSSSGGLSTGAQAGIGVGVGVVGLAILGAAFYLWKRRKRGTPPSELAATEENKPPIGYSPAPQYPPAELDAASTRHELS